MDRVTQQLESAEKALATLREVLSLPPSVVVRDASIQRFEYTFEACWKALRAYLGEVEGLSCPSPNQSIRSSLRVGLCGPDDAESMLQMTADRNLTSHTYIEAIADRIAAKLPEYAALMGRVLTAMRERMSGL